MIFIAVSRRQSLTAVLNDLSSFSSFRSWKCLTVWCQGLLLSHPVLSADLIILKRTRYNVYISEVPVRPANLNRRFWFRFWILWLLPPRVVINAWWGSWRYSWISSFLQFEDDYKQSLYRVIINKNQPKLWIRLAYQNCLWKFLVQTYDNRTF